MTRILFVCLGNICRSPLAEAIFDDQIIKQGLGAHFEADSCGTADYHVGGPPDSRSVRNALKNGISIEHVGRQFKTADFENFDLVIPMDASNEYDLRSLQGSTPFHYKIKLMRYFDSENTGADVPDPYMGNEHDFQAVFEILNRSVNGLILFLRKSC